MVLQWLKMAPLLYPLVHAHGQRNVLLRPAPAWTCIPAHNSSLQIGGGCEKQRFFWHALRDCRYSSVPPRLEEHEEDEEGEEEEESVIEEGFIIGGEPISGTWNYEKFGGNVAAEEQPKREPADVDWLKLTDRELQLQCRVETFRSSGPGGQHRNKTESAVRLLHLPTGCVAYVMLSLTHTFGVFQGFLAFNFVIGFVIQCSMKFRVWDPTA